MNRRPESMSDDHRRIETPRAWTEAHPAVGGPDEEARRRHYESIARGNALATLERELAGRL